MTSHAPQKELTPEPAAPAEPRVNGVYDLPSPARVSGWAIDRADPEAAVEVEISCDGKTLARTRAERYRADLERGGIGTGRYGFSVELDPPLAPELAFALKVRAVTRDGVSGPLRATGKAVVSEDPVRSLLERTFKQTTALRTELTALRRTAEQRSDPPDLKDLIGILDRIEVVQARLDTAAATVDPPSDPPVGPGLKLAVGLALGLSALAVALGLWSVLA